MLTHERHKEIVKTVECNGAASVQELSQMLGASESTIRRDLAQLHKLGLLRKVHGGAASIGKNEAVREHNMQEKYSKHIEDKRRIASFAATLITNDDFVFIDAGTTTEQIADFLPPLQATFVTNGIALARKLAAKGFKTMLIAGRVKAATDAVIGGEAVESLNRYYFSKGFFGTNGVTLAEGFTTPDLEEARNKTAAIEHCRKCYVLCDGSKFGALSNISFAALRQAAIITVNGGGLNLEKYAQQTEVIEL